MKVLEIRDVTRKDVPIYYRMFFSATAQVELLNEQTVERKIDFSIEIMPTGMKKILVTLTESIDYPLVPIIKELKTAIDTLDSNGKLPL
ncbi:MAG: hypothetical protein LBS86_00500 [Treponema sp.]|jgi:glycerol-3-phosphate responsive antiterminator|nr:hypothetical protein [Treponema sp.]